MIRSPAGFDGGDRIKRYLDYYQPSYGVMMLSAGQFSPAQLFANGEVGAWYDPSDLTTLFQDAAGTTPVTAVEQAVGLMLDKRNGLGIGTELISNNTFASDTVWTKGTGWSIGSGVATKTAGTASVLSQSVAVQAGVTYRLVYNITLTAGTITPQLTGGSTVSGTARSATGAYVENITAVSGNVTLAFSADASFAGTVDNVYLKRVSGNDAFQTTSASRPVLSALVNLLTYTEQFDNAAWGKNNATAANTSATNDPLGTSTADKLVGTAAGSNPFVNFGNVGTTGVAHVLSAYAKKAELNWLRLTNVSAASNAAWFNLNTGVVGTVVGTGNTATITDVGNGWYRCVLNITAANYSSASINAVVVGVTNADNTTTGYTGDGTSGIYIWGADLRPANAGVGLPAYQRVNTSTDYDTAGFPMYLRFDGTDDSLDMPLGISTLNLNIWAGARETGSVSANSRVMFIGDSTGSINNVSLIINGAAPASNAVGYRFPENDPVFLGMTTNDTVVVSYQRSSTTLQSARRNGANLTNNTNTTTTFTSTTGRVGCVLFSSTNSFFLNGRIYSFIVRGAASSASQISDTEGWVNSRTRAY